MAGVPDAEQRSGVTLSALRAELNDESRGLSPEVLRTIETLQHTLAPLREQAKGITEMFAKSLLTNVAPPINISAFERPPHIDVPLLEMPAIDFAKTPEARTARAVSDLVGLHAKEQGLLAQMVAALSVLAERSQDADDAESRRHWQMVAVGIVSAVLGAVVGRVL